MLLGREYVQALVTLFSPVSALVHWKFLRAKSVTFWQVEHIASDGKIGQVQFAVGQVGVNSGICVALFAPLLIAT
jgi:hypothetical protein